MTLLFTVHLSNFSMFVFSKTRTWIQGLMSMDANHCGELYLGRPSFVGGKGGEGGVGLRENIFYSKLNQIFQSLVLNTQDLDKGLMKNGCESLR